MNRLSRVLLLTLGLGVIAAVVGRFNSGKTRAADIDQANHPTSNPVHVTGSMDAADAAPIGPRAVGIHGTPTVNLASAPPVNVNLPSSEVTDNSEDAKCGSPTPQGASQSSKSGPAIVAGAVHAETGAPIMGALVTWNFGKRNLLDSTDAAGRYAIQVPFEDTHRGVLVVKVSVESNRYRSSEENVRVCPGSEARLNFRLKAKPAGEIGVVEGEIVNATTKQGLPGATVALIDQGFLLDNLITTTDRDGKYSIRGVGFVRNITLQVSTSAPPCISSIARRIEVDESRVTENFSLPQVFTGRLRCPPALTGPEPRPESAPTAAAQQTISTLDAQLDSLGSPLTTDPSIQWRPATIDAILTNPAANAWHAGHVNDILKLGPSEALVATDSGGVWSLAWNSNSAAAFPLSLTWRANAMTSLARGPDGVDHVYAATWYGGPTSSNNSLLFETDTSTAAPISNWLEDQNTPPCKAIQHVLVVQEARRIVLACDTGIWWSAIPPKPSAHGIYHWQQPVSLRGNINRQFARLAKGPGWRPAKGGPPAEGTIVASAFGGAAPEDLIFYGGWSNGQLVLQPADVHQGNGHLFLIVGRTSVASCPVDAHVMYAVSNDPGSSPPDLIAAVWKSTDGGRSWSMATNPGLPAGNQGDYNQALDVSPKDCNTFALGWRDHTFLSFDGGTSYTALDDAGSGHLHGDYHAVLFDPDDPHTVFMGSDGGLASASGVVPNGSPTFASYYNQHLWDLQFYHSAASTQVNGLIAGPLQDNGVTFALPGVSGTWQPITDSDGLLTEFIGAGPNAPGAPGGGEGLAWVTNVTNWAHSVWDGSQFTNPAVIPVADTQNPRDPAGIPGDGGAATQVRHPSYRNPGGELMYVVSGRGTNMYGLFANSDGTDLHWESIGMIGGGQTVTAVSSFNGTSVFVGTDQGNIYQLGSPYNGAAIQFAINAPTVGKIHALVEFFPTVAFAATGPDGNGSGRILTLLGQSWGVPAGALPSSDPFVAMEAPDLKSLFVATNGQVYVSHDLGNSWLNASNGLPAAANTEDLHFVTQPDGTRYLYLATYGWSMFQARLP